MAENYVAGEEWGAGLLDPAGMAVDAVAGGAGPAIRAARGQISPFIGPRITRTTKTAIGELVESPEFLGDTAAGQGTAIHSRARALMSRERIPRLKSEVRLRNPAGPPHGRVDYFYEPEGGILYDIKPTGAPFPMAQNYLDWSGAKRLDVIEYDPHWRD